MNDRFDDLSALERRLARRQTLTPSPSLRRRVLAGIDAALASEQTLVQRDPTPVTPGMLAAACGAVALTLALLVLMLDTPTARAGRDPQTSPRLSLSERAAAVGITIDAGDGQSLFAAAPGRDRAPTAILRPTDAVRFLEGDL